MAKLKKQEIAFLEKHGISLAQVFDATGLARAQYTPLMVNGGYVVAIGVTACEIGHKMKSKRGKCVQCHPATLAYSKRYYEPAIVYVAYSKAGEIAKVGHTTVGMPRRIALLRNQKCGGYSDWVEQCSRWCPEGPRVEDEIHALLSDFRTIREYGSRQGTSRELYSCPAYKAIGAYIRVMRQFDEMEEVAEQI